MAMTYKEKYQRAFPVIGAKVTRHQKKILVAEAERRKVSLSRIIQELVEDKVKEIKQRKKEQEEVQKYVDLKYSVRSELMEEVFEEPNLEKDDFC